MNRERIIDNLDLTGGSDSGFDLWHTHTDWAGDGNINWEIRKKYIDELISIYDELRIGLKNYPRPFQLWIWILESDSSQDAVYIHTPIPNKDNFPINIKNVNGCIFNDSKLRDYLYSLEFEIILDNYKNELQYYLFDSNIGEPIKKN